MNLALTQGGTGSVMMIAVWVIVFGGFFYFMSVRPEKKRKAQMNEMFANMKAGDSVLTNSGFYGVVIDIMDNTVIVEFGGNRNCRIPMQKEAIAAVESPNMDKNVEE